VYPIQVAEKGICWMRATASGTTGHGSIPRADNAVVRLAEFVARVGRRRLPVHASPVVRRFVTELAATLERPARDLLPLLLQPGVSGLLVDLGIRDRSVGRLLDAVVRNTVSPTVLRAGGKVNVLPSRAEAELDGRIAIGSSEAELLAELGRMAGPDIELEVLGSFPPTETSPDTDAYRVLAEVVAEHHPGAVAIPYVLPGFTDAKFWSRLGTACYGFSPVRLEPEHGSFAERFHAHDERIPVTGFTAGLGMLADAVCRLCCKPAV
jgi:acetylornithine deacetylase/succinyl-diaminopimelate desuccinylase-like protein